MMILQCTRAAKLLMLVFFIWQPPYAIGQSGSGWPLTRSYAKWIDWANHSNADMLGFVRSRVPLPKEFVEVANSLSFRWERGQNDSFECSDPTRLLRVVADSRQDKAAVVACLRTFDYLLESSRAFFILSIAISTPDYLDEKAGKAAASYIDYLQGVILSDIMAAPKGYKPFCTYEYFAFLALKTSTPPTKCADEAVVREHAQPFAKALPSAFFAPRFISEVVIGRSNSRFTNAAWVENWFKKSDESFTDLWIFPILHELGHVALCHIGSVGPLTCRSEPEAGDDIPHALRMDDGELGADVWAMTRLFESENSNASKIVQAAMIGQMNLFMASLRYKSVEHDDRSLQIRAKNYNHRIMSELRKAIDALPETKNKHQARIDFEKMLQRLELQNSSK